MSGFSNVEDGPEILWKSGPCIVVNKPGGLLTQAPPGIDSMELQLRRLILRRENRTGNIYLATCHRLDRPVAGALVFARNVRAARRIASQFETRSVLKVYMALVEGVVTPPSGTWRDFMRKISGESRSEVVPADHPDSQFAQLNYQVLRSASGVSLLRIELETGRTHQIRVQAAARGCPVVGDAQYGSTTSYGPQTDDLRARWIGLVAHRLRFADPMTDQSVDITAPFHAPWIEACAAYHLDDE